MQCSAGIASSARRCENICAAGNSSRQHASSQVDPASCGCNLGRKSPPPLEATARSRMKNLGVAFAEQTSRTVQTVDLALHEVEARILSEPLETAEEFEPPLATEDTHRFLAEL